MAKIADAKVLLKNDKVDKVSVEEATAMHPWARILWGGNSRGFAERLETLGWKSNGQNLVDSLPEMIDVEAGKQGPGQQLTFA